MVNFFQPDADLSLFTILIYNLRMLKKISHKEIIWVDLENPTEDETRQIISEYGIHPLVAKELLGPTLRPKVEIHENFIYLILHFPTWKRDKAGRSIKQQEVDFIIGKDFIITSHNDSMDVLHQVFKHFEVKSILEHGDMEEHAGFVFYYMVKKLYESLNGELEAVEDSIRQIEENIFHGKERAMVMRLSRVSRDLLDVRRAISQHEETLKSFEIAGKRFFGDNFIYHLRAILGEYYKVNNAVVNHFESIAELRETNNSLLNTKETETMKMITLVAFLTLPASVVTNFFQMGTVYTPIVGQPNDWLIVTGVTVLSTIFLLILAKIKKWF